MTELGAERERRFDSIDLVRGLVMVIMLLDHTRDFTHSAAVQFDPMDNARSNLAIYLTRWVTHLCAPTFVLLAGTSSGIQRLRGTNTSDLARFLFTRGLWLVFLELTVVRMVIWWSASPALLAFLQVIWAIGIAMIALAAVVRLPMRVIGLVGLAIVLGHNLLDTVTVTGWQGPGSPVPSALAKLWIVLHQTGVFPAFGFPGPLVLAMYPVIPWVGVLFAGYGMAELYTLAPDRRQRWLLGIAAAMVTTFLVLRTTRLYGDPIPWSVQPTAVRTFMAYMNVQKYGPSLLFLCATLPFALVTLASTDRKALSAGLAGAFVTFGRVPMFFYILQWIWAHVAGIAVALLYGKGLTYFFQTPFDAAGPPSMGGPLWLTYLCWLTGVMVLYVPCRWYAGLKARRKDLTLLRYL